MYATRIDNPGTIRLGEMKTKEDGGLSKDEGEARLAALGEELNALQELLYAAGENALLVVLQGRDTSGKDGAINKIAGFLDVVGCTVASFKAPTKAELARDFLWRVHAQVPPRGQVTFFNRSHYEDVLVVRVHDLVPQEVWRRRYEHINRFEDLLHDAGVIVAKFYLHLSRDEQEERLLAREEEPTKAWKLNPGDWEERERWDDYTAAYEDAIGSCAAPHAPWFVVSADRKWFRNLTVAEALVETLRPYEAAWKDRVAEMGRTQKAALRELRTRRAVPEPPTDPS